jgi:outer membrane protein assembly factor BamB
MKPSRPVALLSALTLFLALHSVSSTATAADWPQWRGPKGDGVSEETKAPLHWNSQSNVLWKTALPDEGNSTPIIVGNRVFITQAIASENRRTVMAFDANTGKELWRKGTVYTEKEESHETNPQASSSPSSDGKRVVAWFGSAGVFCYDLDGKELWKRDLGKHHHAWGYGASPIFYKDLCILNFGPGTNASLIALNKETGKTVWQRELPEIHPPTRTDGFAGRAKGMIGSWSTPILVQHGGKDHLIMSMANELHSIDPSNGKTRWFSKGLNPLVYTSPIATPKGEVVVAMGGYMGTAIAVRNGGEGDVTATHKMWEQQKHKSGIGSGVIVGNQVYFLAGPILHCADLQTGSTLWSERIEGLSAGSDSWSSMVKIGDHLYVLNHSSDGIVLKASEKFEPVAVNKLDEEQCRSSIAVSGGRLFIRTHKNLWCIGEKSAVKTAAKN